jgi:hypothetical protein
VVGEKNGLPAEGLFVRLSRQKAHGDNGILRYETVAEECSGPDGMADLGLVSPGKYELCAMLRDGGAFENFSMPINVLPGSVNTLEIVSPPAKVEKVVVAIRTEMPEDLRRKNLYLTAELVLGPRTFSGSEWRSGFNGAQAFDAQVVIIMAPDGRIGMTYQGIMNQQTIGGKIQMLTSHEAGDFFASPDERPLALFLANHYLKTIRIGGSPFPFESQQGKTPSWLAIKSEWHFLPENRRLNPGPFDYSIASRDLITLPKFTAEPGKVNEWRIVVPEEFWVQVRADLERDERKAKEEQSAEGRAY